MRNARPFLYFEVKFRSNPSAEYTGEQVAQLGSRYVPDMSHFDNLLSFYPNHDSKLKYVFDRPGIAGAVSQTAM